MAVGQRDQRLFEPPLDNAFGRSSLEHRLIEAWEELGESGAADCLVCGARMRVTHACDGCGSELS